jgi:hypothetical protein
MPEISEEFKAALDELGRVIARSTFSWSPERVKMPMGMIFDDDFDRKADNPFILMNRSCRVLRNVGSP